jgi:tetratricopeptide (TPR) repeat protein
VSDRLVAERDLNARGYEHLQAGRTDEALEAFARVTKLFPDSWNAWDSLGEAHVEAGHPERALECYTHSLELNPRNHPAAEHVARLRTELDAPAAASGG